MAKAPEDQPVLVQHLNELVNVLDVAYGLALALDLQNRARNLHGQTRTTPLTAALETQFNRFSGYLDIATETPVEEVDET